MPWLPILGTLGGRPCALGGKERHAYCGGDHAKCKARGLKFKGVDWPECPVSLLLDDSAASHIMALDRHSDAFGLGDRSRHAAWVPDILIAYRQARAEALADPRFGGSR